MSAQRPPLLVRTLAVERELSTGDVTLHPLLDAGRSVAGGRDESLLELRLFLEAHLATAEPEEVARHAVPEGVELRTVTVSCPADLLRGSARLQVPLDVHCAVVPAAPRGVVPQVAGSDAAGGRWVLLLPLDHTLFVAKDEVLEDVVSAEVRRLLAIDLPVESAFRELCPPADLQLVPIDLSLVREEGVGHRGTRRLRRRLLAQDRKRRAREVLRSVGDVLSDRPEARDGPPLVGRERELAELQSALGGSERTSVLLIGPELSGKSALLLAALRRERDPRRFVLATSAARLVAGMSALGQWQERIRRVVESAAELDAILYLDAIGDLLADRASSGTDLVSALRGPVEQGKIRLVGEITPETLGLFESRHSGFLAAFSRLQVAPLPANRSIDVVRARLDWSHVHEPHRPTLDDGAIRTLVDLAARYLPYQSFPGKAVRLLEETRDEHVTSRAAGRAPFVLRSVDVASTFSARTGLPGFLVREDQPLRIEDVVAFFRKRVIGQDEAVRRVAETLCVAKAGLQPPGKPLATFLFVGPTGVGKTEVARTLAHYLFGSAERLVRLDMSEHTDAYAAERLVRGTDRGDGLLTRRIRQRPFCVLLLDEVEKAHPSVHDLLLQLCGEGRLTDGRGRTTWFQDTLVILTSNLGATHRTTHIALGASRENEGDDRWLDAVGRAFRPELVNRFDRIVPFHPLERDDLRRVVEVIVARLSERRGALERRVSFDVAPDALDWLAARGQSDRYGARALRRTVEDELVAPAARLLATLPDPTGVTIRIDAPVPPAGPNLRMAVGARATTPARRAVSSAAISALRREAGKLMQLDRVQSVRAETEFLVAQLAGKPTPGNGRPARAARLGEGRAHRFGEGGGAEMEKLRAEHHRRDRAYRVALDTSGELDLVEELAVVAALEMEDATPLLEDAQSAWRRFRSALLEVLIVAAPIRDEITIAVSELDGADTFGRWLVPLLEAAESRRWTLVVHGHGVKAAREDDWQSPHKWGPPRSPEWLLDQLDGHERPFKHVLLRARGPYVGALLSLEAGLHRFADVFPGHEHAHLLVTRMAMKFEPKPDEWVREAMSLPTPPPRDHLPRLQAVRLHLGDGGDLSIASGRRQLNLGSEPYWARFDDIALEHLLLFEHEDGQGMDRDELFAGRLELMPKEPGG